MEEKEDTSQQIVALILKQLKGTLGSEERKTLDRWLAKSDENHAFMDKILDENRLIKEVSFYSEIDEKLAFDKVFKKIAVKKTKIFFPTSVKFAATISLILMMAAVLFWFYDNQGSPDKQYNVQAQDVWPGTDKAQLLLADGTSIDLHSMKQGTLREKDGMIIIKEGEKIVFKQKDKDNANAAFNLHTLVVPKGGQYEIELSDGSKIGLNSASTLKFPEQFEKDIREVELTGEAYFEIRPNASAPFIVKANGTIVKVLGTNFNVMAYANENLTKTTLISGAVEVFKGNESAILKPGEQATITENIQVETVSAEDAIAWKNGFFKFKNTGLDEVLRQLERWYQVEVIMDVTLPKMHYSGTISRDIKLSSVLEMLELSGSINFEIKNEKLYVKP